MEHIVSPLSHCVSIEKRDRFLDYIHKIAPVTAATEPNCHGYAWFRSAGDNDVVPLHYLRGFEIYGSKDASHVEHRASDAYKAFRSAVVPEGLLTKPSDLQFWHPVNIGFLTKGTPAIFPVDLEGSRSPQYIVTDEFKAKPGEKQVILDHLRRAAEVAEKSNGVLSFWVLSRVGVDGSVAPDLDENSLYVFVRGDDKASVDSLYEKEAADSWADVERIVIERRRTTWVESGIGFLGR
ncbi:hypothetical protein CC79DRAFT_1398910 [Sarocladium strictum]